MKFVWWLGVVLCLGIAAATSCGAVTLEPQPPDEPLPEAAPPPRLLRREGGPGPTPTEDPSP